MTYTRLYETPQSAAAAASTDYTTHGTIGQGTMGTVLEVTREGRRFALKRQSFMDGVPATVLRECMVATQCEHPCINAVVDIAFVREGDAGTSPPVHEPTHSQLVMRLAADGNLGTYLGLRRVPPSQRPLSPPRPVGQRSTSRLATLSFEERRLLAFDVLSALAFLHDHRLIHADLSPHNIVVHRGRARLIDFGLALRDVGQVKGGDVQSLCFRAPEVFLQGAWGAPVDMWSFGCLLRWTLFADEEDYLFDTAPHQGDAASFFRQLLRHRRHAADWPATATERAHYYTLTGNQQYSGRPDNGDFPAKWRPRYHMTATQERALRALVCGCLCVDARHRLTAAEALRNPLFHGMASPNGTWHGVLPPLVAPPVIEELQLLRQYAQELQLTDPTLLLAVDLYSRAAETLIAGSGDSTAGHGWMAHRVHYLFASLYIAAALSAHAYPATTERWGEAAAMHAVGTLYQRVVGDGGNADDVSAGTLTATVSSLVTALGYHLYPDNLFTALGENAVTRAIMHAFIDGQLGRTATRFWQQRRYHELLGMADE